MPVTLRDISKSGGYNPPPGPLSRFPDLKKKIQQRWILKNSRKPQMRKKNTYFCTFSLFLVSLEKSKSGAKTKEKCLFFACFQWVPMGSVSCIGPIGLDCQVGHFFFGKLP